MTNLDEEIKKEMVKLPFFIRGKDQIAFARHFAEWGAEHARDQMMKEAVEADVNIYRDLAEGESWAEFVVAKPPKNLGDKVRIIVCKKEDEK